MDTSALVDALTGPRRSSGKLRTLLESGERLTICSIVLYEWLRGPRREQEIRDQEALWPPDEVVPFSTRESVVAADLYRQLRRRRGREIDLAVAACAIVHDARLWTLNEDDFVDIPGLMLA